MQTLWLLHYNNYYNRLVKSEAALSDYQGYQVKYNGQTADANGNTAALENVNFYEGDFVDTQQVVNWGGDAPDYLLVIENNVIQSHWFVIEALKTRGGQLQLTLHRDLVVDYMENLLDEKTSIFVEKAIVPSTNDLIFNNEAMSFNQIKTSEELLKDESGCPWICVYAAREDGEQTITYDVTLGATVEIAATLTYTEFQDYANNPRAGGDAILFGVSVKGRRKGTTTFDTYYVSDYTHQVSLSSGSVPTGIFGEFKDITSTQVQAAIVPILDDVRNNLHTVIPDYDPSRYSKYLSLANQNIKVIQPDGSAKLYSVKVSTPGMTGESDATGAIWSNTIRPAIEPLYYSNVPTSGFGLGENYASVSWVTNLAQISFTDITRTEQVRSVTIGPGRTHLMDAPYDMFCMPYSDTLKVSSSNLEITASKELALTFASNISRNSKVYDIQLLPYCPLVNTTISDGTLIIPDASSVSPIFQSGQAAFPIGYVLHANKSSFSRLITLENPITITDYKVQNETDLYRLVSPNYNGVFEFSAAKNGGVSVIQLQCTYKPFNPYIKLYPTWGRLYGSDFGEDDSDARGLICGGDFSLPRVTDAWEEYELRNKNYQLSFDRTVQNLEVQHSVQREKELWEIASGVVGAGVQGASGGALAADGVGAALGGMVSAGISLAGGIRDYQLNNRLREETIDYTKDQFGYQLGNIKALPQSLSKVTAYNVDNKYFPFLEYYTCSEVEKQALRDKIKFNGMTVMAIGTLSYYVQNYTGTDPMYFKGKIIRLEGFDGEFHVLNALAQEIYKGVFIL